MRRLEIIATRYAKSPEADEVFDQRGWKLVIDQSHPLPGKRRVRQDSFTTKLIDVLFEEWEYGGEEDGRRE